MSNFFKDKYPRTYKKISGVVFQNKQLKKQKQELIDLVKYYEANPVDSRNRLCELMDSWEYNSCQQTKVDKE